MSFLELRAFIHEVSKSPTGVLSYRWGGFRVVLDGFKDETLNLSVVKLSAPPGWVRVCRPNHQLTSHG